jgi:hypothetical protein
MGGPTMNKRNQFNRRQGLGLLEVIICCGLLAVMMVPIAGVIRASGRSIAMSEGNGTLEAKMRESLRWLADAVRDGTLGSVQTRRITLQLSGGSNVAVEVQRGALIADDGSGPVTLLSDVRDVRFSLLNQVAAPRQPIGLSISLRAIDPTTKKLVTINSTIALPPQL